MTQLNANSNSINTLSVVAPNNDSALPQPLSTRPAAATSLGRCEHRFANATRCRLLVPNPESLFCLNHAQLPEHENAPINLSASLTAGLTDFKSAVTISEFLSRLLRLQAEDRISPRRAAVMAYTANLILRTLPAIEKELYPNGEWPELGDLPRPPNTWRVPSTQQDSSRNAPGTGISIPGQPSPVRQT
jgi:hypothetical protein